MKNPDMLRAGYKTTKAENYNVISFGKNCFV
jgi:hypothetical protein